MTEKAMTKKTTTAMTNVALPISVEQIAGLPAHELAEFDYTSLPVVVNDGDMFKVRGTSWPTLLGAKAFEAIILTGKKYWYFKCSNSEHAIPGVYTYDKETTSRGEPIADVVKMWQEDGCSYIEQPYLQLTVLMLTPDEARNALALVTISPRSVERCRAYIKLELARQRRLQPWQAVTEFYLEDPVTGAGGNKFRPWGFRFVREVDMNAEEFRDLVQEVSDDDMPF